MKQAIENKRCQYIREDTQSLQNYNHAPERIRSNLSLDYQRKDDELLIRSLIFFVNTSLKNLIIKLFR